MEKSKVAQKVAEKVLLTAAEKVLGSVVDSADGKGT